MRESSYKNSQVAILANVCLCVNTKKHFCMLIKKLTLTGDNLPEVLHGIPSSPSQLFCRGAPLAGLLKRPRVAIVGSRSPSAYGRQVTTRLAGELAEQGVVIISGLAMGVDALAHQAALDAGGLTIAVLPGPVDNIYPRDNRRLGEEILAKNGALISECDAEQPTYRQNFIARNRLVAGMAQAVLITEAAADSGSRHTVRFAHKQEKPILAVPGNITSKLSAGPNGHLKKGATPVTECRDVLKAIGLKAHKTPAREIRGRNPDEQKILDLLLTGVSDGEDLVVRSGLGTSGFNQALAMLEIRGKIRPLGNNHWSLR